MNKQKNINSGLDFDLSNLKTPTIDDIIKGTVDNIGYVILKRVNPNLSDNIRVRMGIPLEGQFEKVFTIMKYVEKGVLNEEQIMKDIISYRDELEERKQKIKESFHTDFIRKGKIMGVGIGVVREKVGFMFSLIHNGERKINSIVIKSEDFYTDFNDAIKKYLEIRKELGIIDLTVIENDFLYTTYKEYEKAYNKLSLELEFKKKIKLFIQKGLFDKNGIIKGIKYKKGILSYTKEGNIRGKNGNKVINSHLKYGYDHAFIEILQVFCRENGIEYFSDIYEWLKKQMNKY